MNRPLAQIKCMLAHATLQLPGGQPISYAAARELFGKDASRAWAAYVGGALLVLQREAAGARFPDSLDVLVASGGRCARPGLLDVLGCQRMQPACLSVL